MQNITSTLRQNRFRIAVVVALIAIAVIGAFRFANGSASQALADATPKTQVASSGVPGDVASVASSDVTGGAGSVASTSSGASSGGGGCCGTGGGSGTQVEGTAVVAGSIQKISVDLSSGNYNPNVIKLKAGIPAEITFGQGSGCMGYVQSPDLGFQEDLTGGPQTVKLPGLQPGTYNFACGMGMVPGVIVVE
jgi:hypothetical protein